MWDKIINSMFYGNLKTKLFLWSVFLLILSTLALLVVAFVFGNPMIGLGGAGCGLLALIVSQCVSLNDLTKKKKVKTKSDTSKQRQGASIQHQLPGEADYLEDGENGSEDQQENQEKSRHKREREKAQYLSSMNAKKMKKLMKEHKVNQVHVKVMIDSYPQRKIEQAPAFMWKTNTHLHFMVLTGKAEEFEVPLSEIKGILYNKNVPANPELDYAFIKYSNFIAGMFQNFMPEYHESTKDGKLEITKNTFRIEPGIYLTNTSYANLRKVLLPGVAFLVDDRVIASNRFNEFFKELYRDSILCKNMIINREEYQNLIKENLDAMLDAPMAGQEFIQTLQDLNKYHLIGREHVVEYSQRYRDKHMASLSK